MTTGQKTLNLKLRILGERDTSWKQLLPTFARIYEQNCEQIHITSRITNLSSFRANMQFWK